MARIDRLFKCDGLCIFTVRDGESIDAPEFRKYFRKNWRTIFEGTKKATVLFIGGLHEIITSSQPVAG